MMLFNEKLLDSEYSNDTNEYIKYEQESTIIIKELAQVLASFELDQFKPFKDEWLSYHAFQDKLIDIMLGNAQTITGKAIDISDTGALIVRTDEGSKSFASGEVSIRSAE